MKKVLPKPQALNAQGISPETTRLALSHGIISMGCEYGYSDEEARQAIPEVAERNRQTLELFGTQLISRSASRRAA